MSADDRTLNHSKFLILRRLKQETTVRIWKRYPELKKHFWKEKTLKNKAKKWQFIPSAKDRGVFLPPFYKPY